MTVQGVFRVGCGRRENEEFGVCEEIRARREVRYDRRERWI